MKNWLEPPRITVPESLVTAVGGYPLVGETLVRRGFQDVRSARAFLDPDYYTPASPDELPGMELAADRLRRAIIQREAICVWGDFDVDGQTSTTLLVSALRELGAKVVYHIPVRATESHGVNIPNLEKSIDEGAQLVLTCDTGIAAHEAVAYAQGRGVDVIVSDHHDLTPSLPEAYTVVNPKMAPEGHPLGTLPGVGVAYKLAEALYRQAGREEELDQYLDLVALGIVADIAVQTGDTRYLLQRGLHVLQKTERFGLQVMMELAELDPTWLSEEHIGFVLGPRLNALGRLSDANSVVEFLTTENLSRARILALELEGLNARRKLLTDQVFQGAQTQVERDPSLLEHAALVLAHPSWPAGVIGIVASRLVERYNKPSILISAPPGEFGRGSARSVEGINITAAIATQKDMLLGFGGHPMAAGLSIDPERIPGFRMAFSRTVGEMIGEITVERPLKIDGYLSFSELSLDLVADLERLAPFGAGNPHLVLVSRGLSLLSHSTVGRNAEHLLLTVEDEDGIAQKVVWWQGAGWSLPEGKFDLAYSVRASTFRGQRDIQVEWVDARATEEAVVKIRPQGKSIEVQDYRGNPHPLPILRELQTQGEVPVWSEAEAKDKLAGRDRFELEPSEALVIWTTPAGPYELQTVLENVLPDRVFMFGVDPGMDDPEAFLGRLAGLVKYTLRAKAGETNLAVLAAATAQRESVVRLGLTWMQASGHIRIVAEEDGEIQLVAGEGKPLGDVPWITSQLGALLDETAAYREYFTRAGKEALVRKQIE